MKNSQSVQQKPSKPLKKKLNSLKQTSESLNLLTQNPWLLLTGLLGISLGIAAVAFYFLSYVGPVPQGEPENHSDVVLEAGNRTPSEISNPTPLWMMAAIAFSCSTGCWLILLLLNYPQKLQKTHKHTHRHHQALVAGRHQRLKPRLTKKPAALLPQPLIPTTSISPKTENLMTVLPPEDSYASDTHTESLAELLDIRKHSSLSSILHK